VNRVGGGGSSSQSEKVTALKIKQHNTRQNLKPVIALLAVIFGNVLIILVFSVLHMKGRSPLSFIRSLSNISLFQMAGI